MNTNRKNAPVYPPRAHRLPAKKRRDGVGVWQWLLRPLRFLSPGARLREKRRARCMARRAEEERRALLDALAECRRQLESNDALFNLCSDPDLIESCVYEYRALHARYDCLVRKARAQCGDTVTL